ncbi:ribonuclease H-like domain-containing protein [Tanacetum coccineum]
MTGSGATATVLLSDKLLTVTHHHLLTRVPVKLDLDNWNYASWEYLFDKLCQGYEVTKYIHGSSNATSTSTPTPLIPGEIKVDTIVLSWIFTTISDTLQSRLVLEHPQTAKEAWDLLTDLVKDNKRSRTIALKPELRSLKLGYMSIDTYFWKIESIATILTSLRSPITNEDAATFALEDLPDKYNQVCGIMHHRDTFSDLKTARSMLTIEEMRLKSKSLSLPVDSLSSSPLVLMVESGTNYRPSNPQVKSWRPCYNFAKGSCRFGNDCKFVHDTNAKPANTNVSQMLSNNIDELLVKLLDILGILHDPNTSAWNMDTGVSSHLNMLVTSLSEVFNSCIYPPVSVGDDHSIPVTNTGLTFCQTPFRSLHLNNGFMTRRVFLRCDSTGDLYPVTAPSLIPHVFLVSQHTWHQRLGHPGSEVLHGTLSRYKARLMANGSTQLEGVDVDETFSPVVKPDTIQTILRIFLSQRKYATEILERARMVSCNSSRTPVDTESKLGDDVQQVCLYMHDPRESHLSDLKRILRYVRGTLDYGLQLFSSSTTDLVAYSDADWVGCPTIFRSNLGYYIFLGNNLLFWSSKRQSTLSHSSAEAEYHGVANVVAETCWLRNLLRELQTLLPFATLVYYDNVSAVYLSSNLIQHQCTKHIEIDIHFV